jgi:4-methyl-5(b-hydroxyethyl)-thiazole monophosphate biosynthesis
MKLIIQCIFHIIVDTLEIIVVHFIRNQKTRLPMNKSAYLLLAEGFEEVEALTPVDVLRRAGIRVTTVSMTSRRQIKGAHGIIVTADAMLEDVKEDTADLLILPGGMPGTTNLNAHPHTKDLLLKYSEARKFIGAICAAPMILGQMGLLNGKKATCYPGFEAHLQGAQITNRATEVDGNIITGNGIGSAMVFSLALVTELTNDETARELAKKMMVK